MAMTWLAEAEAANGGERLSEDALGGRMDRHGLWNTLTPLREHGKPCAVSTTGKLTPRIYVYRRR